MKIKDLMIPNPITITEKASISEAIECMKINAIRHLPVVETGWLCGILSIGDVIRAVGKRVEVENRYMRDYIQGAAAATDRFPGTHKRRKGSERRCSLSVQPTAVDVLVCVCIRYWKDLTVTWLMPVRGRYRCPKEITWGSSNST